jgi:hypothetical protein
MSNNVVVLVRPYVIETFWSKGQRVRRVHSGTMEANWDNFADNADCFMETMAATKEQALEKVESP